MCLRGEAEQAKRALLQRFRFIAEGYKEKFRSSKPQNGETGARCTSRLEGYLDRWIVIKEMPKTYEATRDLIISGRFLSNCHPKLAVFVKERNCTSLSDLAETSDDYLEAQQLSNLSQQGTENVGVGDSEKRYTINTGAKEKTPLHDM